MRQGDLRDQRRPRSAAKCSLIASVGTVSVRCCPSPPSDGRPHAPLHQPNGRRVHDLLTEAGS